MPYLRATGAVLAVAFLWVAAASTLRASDPNEIQSVLPRGAIPAIDADGGFYGIAPSNAAELVLGVVVGQEARAYPISVLTFHEIVNDELGGVPIAVTYCPLCATGIVFDRRVNDEPLDFIVSGKLLHNNLVMYDKQTGSLWPQMTGEAIVGQMEGARLEMVPSYMVAWSIFNRMHPNATVLAPPDRAEYGSDPYAEYAQQEDALYPIAHYDKALRTKEMVYGLSLGGEHRAYAIRDVAVAGIVQEAFSSTEIVGVHWMGALSFFRTEGLVFGDVDERTMRSDDGRLWLKATGQEIAHDNASLTGSRLEPMMAIPSYWFAWKDFHPETTVFNAASAPASQPFWQRFTVGQVPNVIALLASIFVMWVLAGSILRRIRKKERPDSGWHPFRPWMGILLVGVGAWFLWEASSSLLPLNRWAIGVPAVVLLTLGVWRLIESWRFRRYEARFGPYDAQGWLRLLEREEGTDGSWMQLEPLWPYEIRAIAHGVRSGRVLVSDRVILRPAPTSKGKPEGPAPRHLYSPPPIQAMTKPGADASDVADEAGPRKA